MEKAMKIKIELIILLVVFYANTSFAGGVDHHIYSGAKSLALNGLYVAGSDGSIKTFSNPAGLNYLNGFEVDLSVSDFLSQSTFESSTRGLFKSLREDDFGFSGGINWAVSDNFKASLSFQQVVNYNVSWPYANYYKQDSLSALLVFDFYNKLNINAIAAAVAYRMDNVLIGVSPVLYNVKNKIAFPQNNDLWSSGIGTAAYQFEYNLDAWAFGFVVGSIIEFSDEFKIGLSIRSGFSADLEGDAKSNMFSVTDSTVNQTTITNSIEMPWIFSIGGVYSINPNLNLNLDFQYSTWGSTQSSINNSFGNSIWQNNLSVTDAGSGINGSSFNLAYKNTFDVGLGFEYISSSNISYRAGYRFSQSPNSNSTYNLLFPAVDHHTFSLGAGLREGNFILDAVLIYSVGIKTEVNNDQITSVAGSYNYDSVSPVINLKYVVF